MGSVPDQSSSRFNTLEVKSLIYQKIGHAKANTYFDQLGKFLTSRISKSEFDKLCIKTIGREHVFLHNRLLRSILKNAALAKSPPPPPPPRLLKKSPYVDSELFPPSSPRKCRSRKKFRDRPSPLGPLGKPQSITTTTNDESMSKVQRLPMEEEGEEVEQSVRIPLTAPLGVSLTGAVRKFACRKGGEGCQNSGELPDAVTLKTRLEKRLEMEGITLSVDSAGVLNSGLDAFITRLIKPCLLSLVQRKRVSMSDLRVAMELNPRVLGEDWPMHLEKVCSRASQE
ncbi:hypothetical protein HA466_0016160 [Hirschfeldia incana]|nr:hypothetical protein HA466_0016160 [Hirschfeldia incana]KAJ0265306.1 hypothetical protein HA466_0016160 [Hirschfeldia incana]KAJ0265307.1 hypothetical protein HA466_0016160 [Hirschfeldia incana]